MTHAASGQCPRGKLGARRRDRQETESSVLKKLQSTINRAVRRESMAGF